MSNRLFQGIIQQMKEAIDRVIGIVDENGIVIASSELSGIGETRQGVREELSYAGDMIRYEGYTYRPIGNAVKSEYIVFVEGTDESAYRYATMLCLISVFVFMPLNGTVVRAMDFSPASGGEESGFCLTKLPAGRWSSPPPPAGKNPVPVFR